MNDINDDQQFRAVTYNDVKKGLIKEIRKAARDSKHIFHPYVSDEYFRHGMDGRFLKKAKKRLDHMLTHRESKEYERVLSAYIRSTLNPNLSFDDSMALGMSTTFLAIDDDGEEEIDEIYPFDDMIDCPGLKEFVTLEMAKNVFIGIQLGFDWGEYPLCEDVLFGYMGKFLDIAKTNNTKMPGKFIKLLVKKVRKAAQESGVIIHPYVSDTYLSYRIDDYYKSERDNYEKNFKKVLNYPGSLERLIGDYLGNILTCYPDISIDDLMDSIDAVNEKENVAGVNNGVNNKHHNSKS